MSQQIVYRNITMDIFSPIYDRCLRCSAESHRLQVTKKHIVIEPVYIYTSRVLLAIKI
jgi:hypothetical protein